MMKKCDTSKLDEPIQEEPLFGDLTFNDLSFHLAVSLTIIACVLSGYLIFQHSRHYTKPSQQKQIIRILLMVPIYSLTACLSIKFYKHHVYLEAVHQFYEALALAAFFMLLCDCLAPGGLRALKAYFRSVQPRKWVLVIRYLRIPRSGLTYFNILWVLVFQFSLVKFGLTLVSFVTEFLGVFCVSSSSFHFAHIWVTILQMFSLAAVMIGLLQFYQQFKGTLKEHNPFLKFLAIKLVIALAYMQSGLLGFLTSGDDAVLKLTASISYQSLAVAIPSALLCLDMCIAAILHLWAYPWKPYQAGHPQVKDAAADDSIPLPSTDRTGLENEECANDHSSKDNGRTVAVRAVGDALNFADFVRAIGRGARWLVVGRKQRHVATGS